VHWLMIQSAMFLTQCTVAQSLAAVLSYSKCQTELQTLCCCSDIVKQTDDHSWYSHGFDLKDNGNKRFSYGHSCLSHDCSQPENRSFEVACSMYIIIN